MASDTKVNRCTADRERREDAMRDSAVIERHGNMERRIEFIVGYDHRAFPEDCGGGGHGQHGMNMCWVLVGPHGAVQWLTYMTNWVPGNALYGNVEAGEPVSLIPVKRSEVGDGTAADLGYHSPGQHYDGQPPQTACEYLPQGYCYYDGSGLNAGPVLGAFLNYGPQAVWAALARYYSELFPVTGQEVTDGE